MPSSGMEECLSYGDTRPLDDILWRDVSTRPIHQDHALALADSIVEVGLLHPLVVDDCGRLLAGAHRLAAVRLIRERFPDTFSRLFGDGAIPVRTISVAEVSGGDSLALTIELSENEKRRNYTKAEIYELVDRLRHAGYKSGSGSLKEGQKHVAPALAVVLGCSLRTVRRLLAKPRRTQREASRSTGRAALLELQRATQRCLDKIRQHQASDSDNEVVDRLQAIQTQISAMVVAT